MAFVTADRVLDTSTSTGTGAIVVAASPPTGYRTFSAVLSASDTFYYSIQHQSLNEYEVGLGTYTSANTFSRTTIYTSSNAGSAVSFSAGTKNVFITMVASRTPQLDASGNLTPATGTYTRTTITATGGQTSFTANYTVNYAEVFVNGILLNSADYTATSGTAVVLASAASAGDIVDVVALNVGTFTGGVTITGTPASGQLASWTGSTSLQGVESFPVWQSVQTGNFTAVAGRAYPIDTTLGAITVTLPASPTAGQVVQITDYAATWNTNGVTLALNGNKLNGGTTNATLKSQSQSVALVYVDSTRGWLAYNGFAQSPISATVSYLVVGGGGGGGAGPGGGGGAGGVLTGTLFVSAGNTYTVTVGAGGASTPGSWPSASGAANGNPGVNSVFGSVTATGGGAGGGNGEAAGSGRSGGSGGGGSGTGSTGAGGSGTSGQGFAGGTANSSNGDGAGGGGASVVGSNTSGLNAGAGGAGLASSITGSSVTYGGGGGGGGSSGSTNQGLNGGAGGGGRGAYSNTIAAVAGTANTGGGGGGGGRLAATSSTTGAAGGSGVVILSILTSSYSGVTTGTPTVTTSGANTILTYTASGSYTA